MAIVNGTSNNDTLNGTSSADTLTGYGGNDSISALDGNDVAYGGAGADSIYGGVGNDTLTGEAGNDLVDGGTGADQLTGGQGLDTFYGGADNDIIIGDGQWYSSVASVGIVPTTLTVTNNADGPIIVGHWDLLGNWQQDAVLQAGQSITINTFIGFNFVLRDMDQYYLEWIDVDGTTNVTYGPNLADLIYGGDGADTIIAQYGNDTVYGGTGNDTVTLGDGNDVFGDWSTDETGNDTVYGGAGNDSIISGAGDDIVYGDAGADTLSGQHGNDTLYGGTGADIFQITDDHEGDTIFGGADFDSIYFSNFTSTQGVTVTFTGSGAGTYDYVGTIGAGTFSEIEVISGTEYADTINAAASSASELLSGAGGNDSITGGSGNDALYGGTGNDTILGNAGADTVDGGTGNDSLSGGLGDDTFYGGDGDDTMAGGAGADSFFGGTGLDIVDYSASGSAVAVNLELGTASGGDAAGDVYGGGVDGIIGSAFNDTLTGANAESTLAGDVYTTYIDGGAGDDLIDGGGGGDTLIGGTGSDTISGGDGNDSITAGDQNDVIYAGYGNDTLFGGAGNDVLQGQWDNDLQYGGTGSDSFQLTDASGVDTIIGGEDVGDVDVVQFIGTTAVSVTYTGTEAGTYAFSAPSSASGTFSEIEAFTGGDGNDTLNAALSSGPVTISGGAGDDSITGGSGADSLFGGAGADTIVGGAGNDSLSGGADADKFAIGDGAGTDTIDGGDTGLDADWLVFDGSVGVSVTYTGDAAGTYTSASGSAGQFTEIENIEGGAGDDTINASASTTVVNLQGGGGNDSLIGGSNSDSLTGGTGDDTLQGGAGVDTLIGGAGSDVFVLTNGGGFDFLSDFDMGLVGTKTTDQLDVSTLTNASGDPVTWRDVVVTDTNGDGTGSAILTCPNAESIILSGVTPSQVDGKQELASIGIPCFVAGTLLASPQGWRAVETLKQGDVVLDWQGQARRVIWSGGRTLTEKDLKARPGLLPVRIAAESLGNRSDVLISPQHAVMMDLDGRETVLVRAKHLAEFGKGSFRVAQGVKSVAYHHILLDQHAALNVQGAAMESMYPGKQAMAALSWRVRKDIASIIRKERRLSSVIPLATGELAAAYGKRVSRLLGGRDVRQALQDGSLRAIDVTAVSTRQVA